MHFHLAVRQPWQGVLIQLELECSVGPEMVSAGLRLSVFASKAQGSGGFRWTRELSAAHRARAGRSLAEASLSRRRPSKSGKPPRLPSSVRVSPSHASIRDQRRKSRNAPHRRKPIGESKTALKSSAESRTRESEERPAESCDIHRAARLLGFGRRKIDSAQKGAQEHPPFVGDE